MQISFVKVEFKATFHYKRCRLVWKTSSKREAMTYVSDLCKHTVFMNSIVQCD